METSHKQSQNLALAQVQKIAPHLIQASEILQCTTQELQQAIERELMENPALESVDSVPDHDRCSDCVVPQFLCTHCPLNARRGLDGTAGDAPSPSVVDGDPDHALALAAERAADPAPAADAEYERDTEYEPDAEQIYDLGPLVAMSELSDPHVKEELFEDAFDPLSLAPAAPSLTDHLLTRLRSTAGSPAVYRAGEYLVSNLDERGWLKIDRTEVMVALSITEALLDEAISALQACDPAGIGARDLRECLLLQLQQMADDQAAGGPADTRLTLARQIVDKHWELLTQRRTDVLSRRTGCPQTVVEQALLFIQNELTPAPASQYREAWNYKPDTHASTVRPDVVIRRSATGFDVELTGYDLPALHVNARYRRLYESIRQERASAGAGDASPAAALRVSLQERRHIAQYVERANLFLKNIQQRKKTIERITRCLIDTQQGYIETGARAFLIPMTRTELAQRTSLHESTVSRALLRKYVQLPTEDVIPFDTFFATAGSVKDMISGLVAAEDVKNPYSDEAIRARLESHGISVARRTIVKYRESLRIPASYVRRRH